MKRFAELIEELENAATDKQQAEALRIYFETADPRDIAWLLKLATKPLRKRPVKTSTLQQATAQASQLPEWLVEANNKHVKDFAETASLLIDISTNTQPMLHDLIHDHVQPLATLNETQQLTHLQKTWQHLNTPIQRFVFNKMITGSFRIPAPLKLITETFASVVGIEQAIIQTRLESPWPPNTTGYLSLIKPPPPEGPEEGRLRHTALYGFAQPSPLNQDTQVDAASVEDLCGSITQWHIEPTLDGIRCQLIHTPDQRLIWSADDERLNNAFPELELLCQSLPKGTVIEGTILAWENGQSLPFDQLQDRLNQQQTATLFATQTPITFFASDLLSVAGEDIKNTPLANRRQLLETLVANTGEDLLKLTPKYEFPTWAQAETTNTTGLHLKHLNAPQQPGLQPGTWWQWQGVAHQIDAVLMHATAASGRSQHLFEQYTFGVWQGDELIPIARTDTGLSEADRSQLDAWITDHAKKRQGGFYDIEPVYPFEIGFVDIARSKRHKAGYTLRHPRILQWHALEEPERADRLIAIKRIYQKRYGTS